jgi:hypothetical protein
MAIVESFLSKSSLYYRYTSTATCSGDENTCGGVSSYDGWGANSRPEGYPWQEYAVVFPPWSTCISVYIIMNTGSLFHGRPSAIRYNNTWSSRVIH